MKCEDLQQIKASYQKTLASMSTEALVEYTLNRDHCQPLEKELAVRLKEILKP